MRALQFAWLFLLPLAATAATASVKMDVFEVGNFGGTRILLPCDLPQSVDGYCFLDTAGSESIFRAMPAGAFKTGTRKINGIGWETSCDEITLPKLNVGNQDLTDFRALLCPGFSEQFAPMVGMNLLWGRRFGFDFGKNQFNWLEQDIAKPTFRVWAGGPNTKWILMSASLGNREFAAAWDTGAPITLVSPDFVASLPELFEEETGIELPPNTKKSGGKAYRVKAPFVVGGVELNGTFVHAVDLKKTFGERLGGLPVILGTNHIRLADWSFDLKLMEGWVSAR